MTATAYPHVDLRADGVPMISGTRTKVVLVVMDWIESGGNLDELTHAYPDLTPGQIFGALTYYHDHKDAFDREMTHRRERAESLRTELEDPSFVARLHAERNG